MNDNILSYLKIFEDSSNQQTLPSKTVLLNEGEIAKNLYYIEKGCLRLYFNNDGKDVTFQFFFEGSTVASAESLHSGKPSMFSLESIETTTVRIIKKERLFNAINEVPQVKQEYINILIQRLYIYQKLFLSRIKNPPQQRYEELVKEYPFIIQRVPQHYIASYLGITPVSLSRIRNRRI